MIITSLDNKKIKELIKLRKTNQRKKEKIVLIDGFREIKIAYEAGFLITEIFFCPELIKDKSKLRLLEKINNKSELSLNVFNKVCYKDKPDGFLALIRPQEESLLKIKIKNKPLVVILEKVEKPGNLGAIIRTSYAAKIDLIIIIDNQTDLYNPNVIRASEGFIFKQKIVKASFQETITWLKDNKIKTYAAVTNAKNIYTQENFKQASAFVLGSEDKGLSNDWIKASNKTIKIPMNKEIDSLNVSVSAAILIYEALRQRD